MSHCSLLNRPWSSPSASRSLCLAAALVALLGPGLPSAASQQMPFVVRAPDGAMHIWTVDEPTGMAVPEIDDVTFLSIRLSGHPLSDRLRTDRPRLEGTNSPAPHIRLPQGGALYRVQSGVETALLRIGADGTPELLVSIPSRAAGPSLQEAVFVSADGRTVAVGTEYSAGGDVILIRLDESESPAHVVITRDQGPLRVEADTLRASEHGAWFVASGELRRAKPTATRTVAVDFDLLRATVLPELVMNDAGTRVGTVVRYEHKDSAVTGDRHVFAVDAAGPPIRISDSPAHYDLPSIGAGADRGPLMALSPDGNAIAFRCASRPDEILARRISPRTAVQRIRVSKPRGSESGPSLEAIRFTGADQLWFLEAGSTAAACLLGEQGAVVMPFELPDGVTVIEAVADPTGTHAFLTASRRSNRVETYDLYEINPQSPSAPVSQVVQGLRVQPRYVALGTTVAVIAGRPQGNPPGDAAEIELHVELLERMLPAQPPMIMLFPDQAGVELSRFAVSPTGLQASFVADTGRQFVMPTYLDLRTGDLQKASKESVTVSPVMAFSSTGSLLVGIGTGEGGFTFGSYKTPLEGARTELPRSYGFPLQH